MDPVVQTYGAIALIAIVVLVLIMVARGKQDRD